MKAPGKLKVALLLALAAGAVIALYFIFRSPPPPAKKEQTLYGYLSEKSVTDITLRLDIQSVLGKDTSDFPAELSWEEAPGADIKIPVQVSSRGVDRLQHCAFPPLKIEVPPDGPMELRKSQYKLVTHCMDEADVRLVFREYLAYQLFAVLTEASFQARLMQITYLDEKGSPPIRSWAILLESNREMRKRLSAKNYNEEGPVRSISGPEYNVFCVFQYMIGNTDFNLDRQHNVRMLVSKEGGLPYPVPYDFDRSGLVNAPYAVPYPTLPIKTVRERYFQWRGKDRTLLAPTIEHFKQHKEEMLALCRNFELLPEADREDMVAYLEEFFQDVDKLMDAKAQAR